MDEVADRVSVLLQYAGRERGPGIHSHHQPAQFHVVPVRFQLLLWGNKRKWALYSLYLVSSLILFADTTYYREFTDFLTVPVLFQSS
ncbi:MAG: hypothetical protein WAL07_13175, partial [Exiguobacterium chiriqhucha]